MIWPRVINEEKRASWPPAGFLLVLPLSALIALLHWRLRGLMFDDAFIHLRIARNYALSGHAFFNDGERVMATSSPLWTIVLTTLGMWHRVTTLSLLEGALLLTCGLLAYSLSAKISFAKRRAPGRLDVGVNAVGSFAFHVFVGACTMLVLLPSSIGQMESTLAIAFLLGAMCSTLGKRIWAVPLLACATSTRLELVPLFAIVFIFALTARWPRYPLAFAAAIAGSVALWVHSQFGILLPNSMHAKSIGYGFSRLEIMQQLFAIPFLERPLAISLLIFFSCIIIQLLQARPNREQRYATWVPIISGALGVMVMGEYVTRKVPIFEWYVPLFWVPILLSLLLYSRQKNANAWMISILEGSRVVSVGLLLLVPLWKGCMLIRAGWQLTPLAIAQEDRQDSARVHEYLVVGSVLQKTCPSGTLMTSEIGALGWSFQGHIRDAFGIASPRAMAFQPLTSGANVGGIPAAYALETKPDLIVSYSALDGEVRDSHNLRAHYRLVELPTALPAESVPSISIGWHKSTHLDVFLREDGSCNVGVVERALNTAVQPGIGGGGGA